MRTTLRIQNPEPLEFKLWSHIEPKMPCRNLLFDPMCKRYETPRAQAKLLKSNEFAFYLNTDSNRPSALLWGGVDKEPGPTSPYFKPITMAISLPALNLPFTNPKPT